MALKAAYREILKDGTRFLASEVCKTTLTSAEIKIKPKSAGIHGLQLADILAHPLTRDVLVSYKRIADHGGWYCKKLSGEAEKKYNKQVYNGRIRGYGRILLA
jgi:hypothetical protein